KIEDVSISDVRIVQRGGGNKEWAGIQVPEKEKSYPEPSMFGALPASTLFLRHVDGLNIRNLDVRFLEEDPRPAMYLQDVHNSSFHNLRIPLAQGQESSVLKEVSGLVFTED
ncbi:MAG: glycoside hydrolase family 28 protein, partial [Bacteroidales bacterium]